MSFLLLEFVRQAQFFDMSGIQKLVDDAMRGYKNTCFAYGQTGSGKTFTMSGLEEKLGKGDYQLNHPTQGIITRALEYLFNQVQKHPESECFRIEASAIEIYNERVYDLLYYTGKPLAIRQSKLRGFIPENLRTFHSPDMTRMSLILHEAHKNRRVASHNVHADSSRSHAVFTIHVNHRDFPERSGQLTFVDLAGSEKVSNTGAAGKLLKEANFINKSLFTLGKVISKLSHPTYESGSTHVPFRDSALTKLLKDSFTGGTQTIMIACVSPGASSLEETVNTAQYATRAKNIVNKPALLIDPEKRLKADLLREVKQLRADNVRLCRQIERLGAVPVTVSGKSASPNRGGDRGSGDTVYRGVDEGDDRTRSLRQSRPGSSYSSRSAPLSRGSSLQSGFLPPIDAHRRPQRAESYVNDDRHTPATYAVDDRNSYKDDQEYTPRPHRVSPMQQNGEYPNEDQSVGSYDSRGPHVDALSQQNDDFDDQDSESQSSSASVDSETGQRVYDYHGEVWSEEKGRFVAQADMVSPHAASLGGVNPVVAAYDGQTQHANPAARSPAGPGYAARALLKKHMMKPSPKSPQKSGGKSTAKQSSGYLAQFKQGRVPRQ